jgi:hypothetical protein
MDLSVGPARRVFVVSLLLFGSGMCALVYQTVWLREFRLIFGTSTAASAAVLSIFMGGLGVGGIILGARADNSARPLRFYARLELLIAVSAAGYSEYTRKAVAVFEPNVLWERQFLQTRRDCYRTLGDPLAAKAERDLAAFIKAEPASFLSHEQN